jgi:glycogen(starch) synthase
VRVLFVSRELPPDTGLGGIGSYVASAAPGIAGQGHDVHVLSCFPGQPHRDIEVDGVSVHRRGTIRARGLRRLLGRQVALRVEAAVSVLFEFRRLGRFDVVEVPDWMAEGLLLGALLDVPVVSHLHTPFRITREFDEHAWTLADRLADRLERSGVARSTATTCPSRLLVDALRSRRWLGSRAVDLIRYPVDWDRWHDVADVAKTARIVAVVGRVERRKGHALLIDAMERLAIPDARLLVVGRTYDADLERELAARAVRLGVTVDWIGPVDREALPRVLDGVRVLAMPSEFDSFGMAATEAMAAGRPVVVGDAVGVGELGGEGLDTVRGRDPDAWAAALRPYLVDIERARRAGTAARRTVRAQCDPATIGAERIECYERAVAATARRRRDALRPSRAAAPLVRQCAPRWFEWAADAAAEVPWKHFYLATAEQLLQLIRRVHPDLEGRGLAGSRICDLAATPPVSAMLVALGATVVQVDIEMKELDAARAMLEELDLPTGGLVCADAFRTPLRDASFDLVWNSGFVEHFSGPGSIVGDMARLARPAGAVCVLVPASFTAHTLVARPLARRRGEYYWDWVGKEGDFTARSLGALLSASGLELLASGRANVRRSVVDDRYVLKHERRRVLRPAVGAAMRYADALERSVPAARALGFTAGAIGRKSS